LQYKNRDECLHSGLGEAAALAEAGKIKPHIESFPMTNTLAVYEKLQHGDITGRAGLIP
jgi:D-arabinose 1-dehydrogenase-like Zn-dependent alcohol dehydrogenase